MNPARKLEQMLRQHNFKPVRHNSHRVFKNHEGKIFVTALTPSDYRWAHNAISILKKVLSSPARPMVLAISDYEREQATEKIAGQQKRQIGQSNGKSKRSKGTGFIYEDRNVLTEEDKLQRENQRKQAQENAQRRREKKLAQRAAIEQERQRKADEFEKTFGEFLRYLEGSANQGIDAFCKICKDAVDNKAWKAETFYEFSQDVDEKFVHKMFQCAAKRLALHEDFQAPTNYEESLRAFDKVQDSLVVESHDFLASVNGEMRKTIVEPVVHTVRRLLGKNPSISNLETALKSDARKRFSAAKNLNAHAYAWVLGTVLYNVSRLNEKLEQVGRAS